MYSDEVKENVIAMLNENKTVSEIHKITKISLQTINKWKKEQVIIDEMYNLIEEEKFEEVLGKLDQLSSKSREQIRLKVLIKIAREKGDKQEEEKLLRRQLEINPNNVIAISSLIRVVREKGDKQEEERLSRRQLEVNPNDVIAISNLIKLAREKGDIEEEEKLIKRHMEIIPNNIIIISSLIKVARKKGDKQQEEDLLRKILEIDPNNEIAKISLNMLAERELRKKSLRKSVNDSRKKEMNIKTYDKSLRITQARKLIYDNGDIVKNAEKIRELLDGEDRTEEEIIKAELYSHVGMIDRAKKSLKNYRKNLDPLTQSDEIKKIMKIQKLVENKNFAKMRGKWEEFWEADEREKENKQLDQSLER